MKKGVGYKILRLGSMTAAAGVTLDRHYVPLHVQQLFVPAILRHR